MFEHNDGFYVVVSNAGTDKERPVMEFSSYENAVQYKRIHDDGTFDIMKAYDGQLTTEY